MNDVGRVPPAGPRLAGVGDPLNGEESGSEREGQRGDLGEPE
jgi:hypothetical protein